MNRVLKLSKRFSSLISILLVLLASSFAFSYWLPVNSLRVTDISGIVATPDSSAWCKNYTQLFHWNRTTAQWDSFQFGNLIPITRPVVLPNGTVLLTSSIGSGYSTILHRSTDDGASWDTAGSSQIVNGGELQQYGDTLVIVGNPVCRSTDAGLNWVTISQPFEPWIYCSVVNCNRGRLIALAYDEEWLSGYYLTLDFGMTWRRYSSSRDGSVVTLLNDTTMLQSSSLDSIFYITQSDTTWRFYNRIPSHATSFYWDGDSVLYATTDEGLYRLNTTTVSWDRIVHVTSPVCMVRLSNSSFLFGAHYGATLWDRSSAPVLLNNGFPKVGVFDVVVDINDQVLALSYSNHLFFSRNLGNTWEALDFVDHPLALTHAGTLLAGRHRLPAGDSIWHYDDQGGTGYRSYVSPTGEIYYLRTSESPIYSTDDGISWHDTPYFPDNTSTPASIAATSDGTVLVGTNDYLCRLPADSAHWAIQRSMSWVYGLDVRDNGYLYAAKQGFGGGNLYRSRNEGQTWEATNLNMNCYKVMITRINSVVVDANDGVFRSDDCGDTFRSIPIPGVEPGHVNKFFQYQNPYIFAVTDQGLFISEQSENDVDPNSNNELPQDLSLHQNYPNPFNSTTKIQYSLPQSGKIELTLYDPNGREVQSLYRGYRQAGSYQCQIDSKTLASGMYFVRLSQGDRYLTQKIILIK